MSTMDKTDKKYILIKDTFLYSVGRYMAQGLNFFTAVLMRKFLGPFNMGVWNLLKVVRDYAEYSDLGTNIALSYKFPYHKGKGESFEADKIKDVVFNFAMLGSIVIAVGLVLFSLIFRQSLTKEIYVGLFAVAILIIFQKLYTYYIILLRSNKDFTVLSKSIVFDSVMDLLLILLLVYKFGLYGLYATAIILPILNILYIRRQINYKLKFSFDLNGILSYIKFGFPLFVVTLLLVILNSVDKIMIASMLGLEQLGFFSIAFMAKSYNDEISKNITHIITPHFFEDWGKSEDPLKNSKYVTTVTIIVSYFMVLLLGSVFIVAPVFITYVLPKFIPGITAMKLYIIASFFSALMPFSSQFLIAVRKQYSLMPIMIFTIILNVIFNYVFIRNGFGISGVAAATLISVCISFIMLVSYAMRHFEDMRAILRDLASMLLPIAYTSLVLIFLEGMPKFSNIFLELISKESIFLAFCIPLILFLNQKTSILNMLFAIIAGKLKPKK